MDGATVLVVALAVGFVLVVVFFTVEKRKTAGKSEGEQFDSPHLSRRR
jgi:hypothetical protein